jgi:oligogalacturonide transport system substrate-binding protein
MKKLSKILSILLLLSLVLVGCSSGGSDTTGDIKYDENEQVTLRVSWWGGDARHEATLKAIELFESRYPNIKIEAEYGGWSGHLEKVTTQIAGRTAPDVMQINWNWLWMFSKDGNGFFDLNRLADYIDLSNWDEQLLEQTTINGKLNALPVGIGAKVFYFNEDAYKAAGVEIPKTFDDLIKAADAFKQNLGPNYYPFDLDSYNAFLIALYYLEQKYGIPYIDNETNQVAYSVEQIKEGLDFYLSLVEAGVTPSLQVRAAAGDVPVDQTPAWIQGRLGGIYEWDSAIDKFQAALEGDQKLVTGQYLTGIGNNKSALTKISMTFAINADTQYPAQAAIFLDFLLNDPEAAEILGTTRGIPASKAALQTLESKGMLSGLTYEGNTLAKEFMGLGISPYFENDRLQSLYREVLEQLGYGVIDSQRAAERLVNDVNSILRELSR